MCFKNFSCRYLDELTNLMRTQAQLREHHPGGFSGMVTIRHAQTCQTFDAGLVKQATRFRQRPRNPAALGVLGVDRGREPGLPDIVPDHELERLTDLLDLTAREISAKSPAGRR